MYYARINTDTFIGYISDKLTTVNSYLSSLDTKLTTTISKLGTLDTRLSSIDTRLSTIKDYLVSDDTETGNTYTVATWVKRCYNTLQTIEDYLASQDSDSGNLYTVATWAKRIYNRMGDMISAINSLTVGFDASDVHLSVDASTLTFNLNAFCFSPASGSTFETLAIPYDTATDIVARLNTDYMGQKCTILLRSGGTSTAYFRSAYLNSSGYITAKMTNGVNYYLCDNSQVIYVADSTTNYGSKTISKLTSVQKAIVNAITAIGTQLDNLPSHDNSDVVSSLSDIGTKLDALPIPDNTGIEDTLSNISTALTSNHTALINTMSVRFQSVTSLLSGISTKMDDFSIGGTDLTGVTTRMDTIIEELQSSSGEFSCEHTYTQEMTQAPTCILPGLQVSTCSKCGSSYSEIVAALGHDWQCTDHVEDVTDPDTGEVTETGYDIYTCSRCSDTYNDYSGSGAPSDYGDTNISKIIVSLFSKLGTFAGKILSWIIGLFDKLLGGLDDLITRFSELTAQIAGFGGDYPAWLSGFWGILPQELQLALGFSFVCLFVGLIGRKLFFA